MELNGRRKDGSEFPVEVALSLLSWGRPIDAVGQEPIEILGALRDLTERNKIRTFLAQNEKLASIGMLSAGVAHEINNPLAFVANNLVVLERDSQALLTLVEQYESVRAKLTQAVASGQRPAASGLAASLPAADPWPLATFFAPIDALGDHVDVPYICANLPRMLQRTREGVDRVSKIVHSLRGLARTDVPRRQETHLPDLVASSLEILRGRLKKSDIAVEQEHDPVPRVFCVATQVSQVILNLLLNAVQAIETHCTEGGGRIVIRTRRFPYEMVLEIEDNGCGIPPENMGRLFDPFFTTKEVGEGTGLGLSITHNIITSHGGRVEVNSRPGEGAVFRIILPLRGAKQG